MAAKAGTPMMTSIRPSVPLSVPAAPPATGPTTGGVSDVTVQPVTDTTALDTKPDARANPGAARSSGNSGKRPSCCDRRRFGCPVGCVTHAQPASTANAQPLPMNHQNLVKKTKKQKKAEEARKKHQAARPSRANPTCGRSTGIAGTARGTDSRDAATTSGQTKPMNRILLADHSPHAQRMGERILRDEGYEVAAVTDGETACFG